MITHLTPLTAFQYLVFGCLTLYFGRDIFIPISFALLLSFIIYPFVSWMERKGIGRMTAIIINVSLLTLVVIGIVLLLTKQFFDFLKEWPTLQAKLKQAFSQLSETLTNTYGISHEQQGEWMSRVGDETASGLMRFMKQTISFSAFSLVMMILIPVYTVLILYYRQLWIEVVARIFPAEKKENIKQILTLSIRAYYNFIKGMGLVYLIVGVLNSVGLLILGVPHAIFFGLIASILTFIPYIGIIVGSLLPITMAWATYDSIWYPIAIIAIFTFVQYIEANLIFPLAVSNRLQVNTFVMLVAIFAGGVLWGVAGMILFVPFLGILKLIADNNPHLSTLSLVLGTRQK